MQSATWQKPPKSMAWAITTSHAWSQPEVACTSYHTIWFEEHPSMTVTAPNLAAILFSEYCRISTVWPQYFPFYDGLWRFFFHKEPFKSQLGSVHITLCKLVWRIYEERSRRICHTSSDRRVSFWPPPGVQSSNLRAYPILFTTMVDLIRLSCHWIMRKSNINDH